MPLPVLENLSTMFVLKLNQATTTFCCRPKSTPSVVEPLLRMHPVSNWGQFVRNPLAS